MKRSDAVFYKKTLTFIYVLSNITLRWSFQPFDVQTTELT